MTRATTTDDAVAAARAEVLVGDWAAARAHLQGHDDAVALELLADVAMHEGDLELVVGTWERLHELAVARADVGEAARTAAMVAMHLMIDSGLMSAVRGWLARVDRLLGADDGPAAAVAAMVRTYERFMCGDLPGAASWAARSRELGARHDVLAAEVVGRVASARVRILDGAVAPGLAELDEVAELLLSGAVDPLTTGMMACELVCAAQGLAQPDRAEAWTTAFEQLRDRGASFLSLTGRCRVHRAEVLRLRGSCEDAEVEILRACEELRPWMRRELGWPLHELGTIRLRRGDLDGAEEALLEAHARGWDPQPALALLHLARGDADGALRTLTESLDHPVHVPSKERPPAGGLTRAPLLEVQVVVALAVGDAALASAGADELAVLATRYGSRSLSAMASGARARVCSARGEAGEAVDHARAAVDAWCDVGAPFETALARRVLASTLEHVGETALARLEHATATRTLAEIGAVDLLSVAPVVDPPTTSSSSGCVFREEAGLRHLTWDGTTVVLRDLVGMRHLALLLERPGVEVHALDLVQAVEGAGPTAVAVDADLPVAAPGAGLGPVLDEQARVAYRRRLREVEEDIDEAERCNDHERASLARADRDFLVRELTRAFGLGGRPRPVSSQAERARTSVTRSVRYSLDRITEVHPVLGRHLSTSVRTGTYLCYAPDDDHDWQV